MTLSTKNLVLGSELYRTKEAIIILLQKLLCHGKYKRGLYFQKKFLMSHSVINQASKKYLLTQPCTYVSKAYVLFQNARHSINPPFTECHKTYHIFAALFPSNNISYIYTFISDDNSALLTICDAENSCTNCFLHHIYTYIEHY